MPVLIAVRSIFLSKASLLEGKTVAHPNLMLINVIQSPFSGVSSLFEITLIVGPIDSESGIECHAVDLGHLHVLSLYTGKPLSCKHGLSRLVWFWTAVMRLPNTVRLPLVIVSSDVCSPFDAMHY
jgi:hypothetical protein